MLFKELHPLIVTRPLTLTIVSVPEGKIRVCVVPQSLDDDDKVNKRIRNRKEVAEIPKEAIKALTTPLSLEGPPEELDAELPGILAKYVNKHVSLQESLTKASAEIDQAVAAIEQRDKEKSKAAKATKGEEKKTSDKAEDKKSGQEPKNDGIPLLWCAQPGNTPSESSQTEEVNS